MPVAECKLCLKSRNLVESHLAPRALYKLCRDGASNPILVTSDIVVPTSRQTRDHLLCHNCEELLNREGETWVLPKLARADGDFPLHDILNAADPFYVGEDGLRAYAAVDIPNLQITKLIHFALGVFWKASVHTWAANRVEPSITLGPYSEPLRTYLLGETAFPDNMALVITVLPSPVKLIMFNQPYEGPREKGGRKFIFYVPGIQFSLLTGKSLEHFVRTCCAASNPGHPVFVSNRIGIGRVAMEFYASARKSQKYLRHLKSQAAPTSKEMLN